MTALTRENAPAIQSLLQMVNKDKPDVDCMVRVLRGKHAGKVGTVRKHVRSRFENPYRYANEMMAHMIDARGRYGFAILVATDAGATFWTKADYVMVCCTKEWA